MMLVSPAPAPPQPPALVPYVPAAVAQYNAMRSVHDVGWSVEQLIQTLRQFEQQCLTRVIDPLYWRQYPWKGVYEFIQGRLQWNAPRCHNQNDTLLGNATTSAVSSSLGGKYSVRCAAWRRHLSQPCCITLSQPWCTAQPIIPSVTKWDRARPARR